MSELDTLHDTYDRIDAGEPIRILVGHVLHRSTEIELAPGYADKLRAELLRGVGERIIALTPPDPSPAAPALPTPEIIPAEGGKACRDAEGAQVSGRASGLMARPLRSEPAGDSVRT